MAGHPLADWLDASDGELDDDQDGEEQGRASAGILGARQRPRRPRLALLAAAAAALWAAVALALLLGGEDEDEDPGGLAPTTETAGDPSEPHAAVSGASATGGGVPADEAAAAVIGARLEVARLAEGTGRSRYVDAAVAEGAERVGDLVVVRVLAVVLEGEDGTWTSERVERFAVPLRADVSGEPALAGAPWPLPAPAGDRAEGPTWADSDEPAPGVAEALEAAGFQGVADLGTAGADDAPLLRATFTADLPPGRHEVWLTDDQDTRVLGLRARDRDDTQDDTQGGH